MQRRFVTAGLVVASVLAASVQAQPAPVRKADLADLVAGDYIGAVIDPSDETPKQDVVVTLSRTGPNFVTVSSDYARFPVITFKLATLLGKIVFRDGSTSFVYDAAVTPPRLEIGFGTGLGWAGSRK